MGRPAITQIAEAIIYSAIDPAGSGEIVASRSPSCARDPSRIPPSMPSRTRGRVDERT